MIVNSAYCKLVMFFHCRMSSFGIKASTSQKDLQKSSTPEISSQGKATSELALDGWDSIALEYSVDWPLQLFFTPDVVSKYVWFHISTK